jgi:hypothetical protein
MNLIIYEARDRVNEQFYRTLAKSLRRNTVLINTHQLASNPHFSLSVSNQSSGFTFENDEISLNSKDVTHTINCVQYLDIHTQLMRFQPGDRGYIQQEWHAIFLSMLYTLKDSLVFNQVLPLEFTDRVLSKVELQILLNQAGLSYYTPNQSAPVYKRVLFWNGQFFGHEDVPSSTTKQLMDFCAIAGVNFCQFSLCVTSDHRWVISEVTFQPSVAYYSRAYLYALTDYLNR